MEIAGFNEKRAQINFYRRCVIMFFWKTFSTILLWTLYDGPETPNIQNNNDIGLHH